MSDTNPRERTWNCDIDGHWYDASVCRVCRRRADDPATKA